MPRTVSALSSAEGLGAGWKINLKRMRRWNSLGVKDKPRSGSSENESVELSFSRSLESYFSERGAYTKIYIWTTVRNTYKEL